MSLLTETKSTVVEAQEILSANIIQGNVLTVTDAVFENIEAPGAITTTDLTVTDSTLLNTMSATSVTATNSLYTGTSAIDNAINTVTVMDSPFLEPSLNRIAWSPTLNLFAVVAQSGRGSKIATSPDGINWTSRPDTDFLVTGTYQVNLTNCNAGAGVNEITCLDTSKLFVGAIIFSTNTVTVTAINSSTSFTTSAPITGLSNSTLNTQCFYCNKPTPPNVIKLGMLVGLSSGTGSSGARNITALDDTDLLITKFTLTSTRNYNASTCYVGRAYFGCTWCSDLAGTGYFVASAVNSSGQQIVTSSNGITWTLRNTPVGYDSLGIIAYSPTLKRVVVCAGSLGVIYSNDGINWTGVTNPGVQTMNCITWSSTLNKFLCLGSSSSYNTVFSSSDGITWTTNDSTNLEFRLWSDITYSPELGYFVAISSSSSAGNVTISVDGTTWERYSTPQLTSTVLTNLIWVPELSMFVTVSSGGTLKIFYSFDGKTWIGKTGQVPSTQIGYKGVAYSPTTDLFVFNGSASISGVNQPGALARSNFVYNSGPLVCSGTLSCSGNTYLNGPLFCNNIATTLLCNSTVVCNSGAIATTATTGFLYIPTCPGPPTGTPFTYNGRAPLVIDSVNRKLYFYSNGWKLVTST